MSDLKDPEADAATIKKALEGAPTEPPGPFENPNLQTDIYNNDYEFDNYRTAIPRKKEIKMDSKTEGMKLHAKIQENNTD